MEELPRAVTAVLATVPRWKSLIRRRHCPHGVLLVNRLRRLRILVFHRKTASRFPQGVASFMTAARPNGDVKTCEAPPRDKALSLVNAIRVLNSDADATGAANNAARRAREDSKTATDEGT